MKFNNPEILFLLLLLLIPLFIHLFQLQKFQKIAFTNVKLLRLIEQQTRKSSKLKKILILLSRLLMLTCLIIAFSEPFYSDKLNLEPSETIIYLDNSFSMQAKGEKGELLQNIKHDLVEFGQFFEHPISLITNNDSYSDAMSSNLKNKFLDISNYPKKKTISTILLQADNIRNGQSKNRKNIILISDFQVINGGVNMHELDSSTTYYFVQYMPNNLKNISLDSVWVAEKNFQNIILRANITSYQTSVENLSISIFVNQELYGKTSVSLDENATKEVEFSIPFLHTINGKITLDDDLLSFDNKLHFAINKEDKTRVLSIGEPEEFLSRIYTNDQFIYTTTEIEQLDYSKLDNQDLILLNRLETIPNTLINTLKRFVEDGHSLVIIPSKEIDLPSYNNMLAGLNMGKANEIIDSKKSITNINYKHPFFKNVFQKEISNFQYPTVEWTLSTLLINASPLLIFNDQTNFVSELKRKSGKIYWFASSLDQENSNFISSPLVVPTFYNFANQSTRTEDLYYMISDKNEFQIKIKNKEEDIYHIKNEEYDFIPLQSRTINNVKIKTELEPSLAGNYQISNDNEVIKEIAYNYNREENKLVYESLESLSKNNDSVFYFDTINEAITSINDQYKKHNLWQLFIIFALLFLVIEMLLQKFLKT